MADGDRKPKGYVTINRERCKGCGYCVEFCPTHVLQLSQEFNGLGYHYPVVQNAQVCSGCDQCGSYCPDFAVFGTSYKKE